MRRLCTGKGGGGIQCGVIVIWSVHFSRHEEVVYWEGGGGGGYTVWCHCNMVSSLQAA